VPWSSSSGRAAASERQAAIARMSAQVDGVMAMPMPMPTNRSKAER
jgi:hypothetical protein